MEKQLQDSTENTRIILKSNQDLTKTIVEMKTERAQHFPDPSTTHQRQMLGEEVQRENCVLTIANCTETLDGKPGWLQLMTNLRFRNGFDADKFGSGVLKSIILPGNTRFTTVTFKSKNERYLFFRNEEKKRTKLKIL